MSAEAGVSRSTSRAGSPARRAPSHASGAKQRIARATARPGRCGVRSSDGTGHTVRSAVPLPGIGGQVGHRRQVRSRPGSQ
ncbi:MAG: hypothetical protein QG608_2700 [Actinomycetota bacterium]|nr:hypothetical protein [Actinomycetota bacterium]